MGCSCSTPTEKPMHLLDKRSTSEGQEVEVLVKSKDTKSPKRDSSLLKVVITGTGQSGKTTLARYMKLALSDTGLSVDEYCTARQCLHMNILDHIKAIVRVMENNSVQFTNPDLACQAHELDGLYPGPNGLLSKQAVDLLIRYWEDPAAQKCFASSPHGTFSDGAKYLLGNLVRYREDAFEITERDILCTNLQHSDDVSYQFEFWKYKYLVYDYPAQRPMVASDLSDFNCVEFIMYCVSLADYDLVDEPKATFLPHHTVSVPSTCEDASNGDVKPQNRLLKSLHQFQTLCAGAQRTKPFTWLVLNKLDMFQRKLAKKPLSVCFPEYTGRNDARSAREYIKAEFRAVHPMGERLYVSVVNATDLSGLERFKKAFIRASELRSLMEYGLF